MSGFDVEELVPLLTNERRDVRLQALQIAAHVVDSTNVKVFCNENVFNNILLSLEQRELRVHSVSLIINMIAAEGHISQTKLLTQKMVDFLSDGKCPIEEINIYLILLTNLTVSEDISGHFINYCTEKGTSQILLDRFLEYDPENVESVNVLADYSEVDVWQYFSSVLCNICRLNEGRRLLLSITTNNMAGCLRQFRSKNPIRRRGAVACVRSCLFDADIHWWMVHEMNVLTELLLPLVTETELTEKEKDGMDPILWTQGPNKQPEPEVDIRKMLLESLQLLGQKRAIREEMRKHKVYPICRNLDLLQDDEECSNIIFEIVQLTMGDEDPNNPIDDAIKSKPMVNDLAAKDLNLENKGDDKINCEDTKQNCDLDEVD